MKNDRNNIKADETGNIIHEEIETFQFYVSNIIKKYV